MSRLPMSSAPGAQALRFVVVGAAATFVHTGAVWLAMSAADLHHTLANVLAFLVAFEVSFHGHTKWSFVKARRQSGRRWRLLLTALGGLALNLVWGWLVFDLLQAPFLLFALLQAGITPLIVFSAARSWAYRAN